MLQEGLNEVLTIKDLEAKIYGSDNGQKILDEIFVHKQKLTDNVPAIFFPDAIQSFIREDIDVNAGTV